MVDSAHDLQPAWFEGRRRVGLTAGASAPEVLVQQVIDSLRELGAAGVRRLAGVIEERALSAAAGPGRRAWARSTRAAA